MPNRLADDDTQLPVELQFENLDDFEPTRVAEQVPALNKLLDMRRRLSGLLGKMEGNDKLESLLGEVISNSEAAKSLADEMGVSEDEAGDDA